MIHHLAPREILISKYEKPLVSCLCVTWNRTALLERSIGLFNHQTYPNKELVVVCRSEDYDTLNLLRKANQTNIKVFSIENASQRTLGELRNISIENSKGDYVCQWDDDDWYHPTRIDIQHTAIRESGKRGSVLSYILMFDMNRKQAYLSTRRAWENSVMCERRLLTEESIKFPALNKGEDTPFVSELINLNVLVPVVKPELYIYNNTGINTCDSSHFASLYGISEKLSDYHSNLIGKLVLKCSNDGIAELSSKRFVRDYRLVQELPEGFDLLYSSLPE
jgi:glycosyltransferase involved in cell wall biosynthesis